MNIFILNKSLMVSFILTFLLINFGNLKFISAFEENIPKDETESINKVTQLIESEMNKNFSKAGVSQRDVHVKSHGCVNGKITSYPQELIPRVGVFSSFQPKPVVIRFSNGSGSTQKDSEGDARGMAIKVLNVPGEKILENEKGAQTQDFLLLNHPVFFIKDAKDYVSFQQAVNNGGFAIFLFFSTRWKELGILNKFTSIEMSNPLNSEYFSTTPYLLGKNIVKYSVSPCHKFIFNTAEKSDHFLRENMDQFLKTQEACFEFKVQMQTNPKTMPIEDPREEWSTKESPFISVAKIEIPIQNFNDSRNNINCENMSFTPWHSLPEHRPLGGINRARKAVYDTVSRIRHGLNKVERNEPNDRDQ